MGKEETIKVAYFAGEGVCHLLAAEDNDRERRKYIPLLWLVAVILYAHGQLSFHTTIWNAGCS